MIMVRRKVTPSSSAPFESDKERNKKRTTEVANYKVKRYNRVLQEIRYLRKTTSFVIPKLPFARLVRSIMQELFPRGDVTRLQSTAFEALQEATEMYLVQFFEDAVLLAFHAKRVTLMKHDMILTRRLRGRGDIVNR